MKVVAIGDSITFGDGLQDLSKRWTNRLSEIYSCEVQNAGKNRDTSRAGLERFPLEVQSVSPDVCLIQFGFNDCNHWESDNGLPRVSLASFEASIIEMVDRCRAFEITPILLSTYKTLKGEQYEYWRGMYQRSLDAIAFTERIQLVRFVISPKWYVDDLHLNEQGHLYLADTVAYYL